MRKILTIMLTAYTLAAFAQNNTTQEARPIKSLAEESHPTEWYQQQSRLWRKEIEKDKNNECAWENYLQALHFAVRQNPDPTNKQPLIERSEAMKELINTLPDSPTRYIMEFYMKGPRNEDSRQISAKVFEAIRNNPDRVKFYDKYIAYLLMEHPDEEQLIADICQRWYNSRLYSPNLLNHFYNQLSGLPQNAVLFISADSEAYSILILQKAKGVAKNVTPILTQMLHLEPYRKYISKQLGIAPFPTKEFYDDNELYNHVINNSERPVYFSATSPIPSFTDRLYNEGLAFRYSPKAYDNIAVKRHNFENVYMLDYLRMSFYNDHPLHEKIKTTYVTLFKSLLDYYKESGNNRQYDKLYSLLKGIIDNNSQLSNEEKRQYEHELNR